MSEKDYSSFFYDKRETSSDFQKQFFDKVEITIKEKNFKKNNDFWKKVKLSDTNYLKSLSSPSAISNILIWVGILTVWIIIQSLIALASYFLLKNESVVVLGYGFSFAYFYLAPSAMLSSYYKRCVAKSAKEEGVDFYVHLCSGIPSRILDAFLVGFPIPKEALKPLKKTDKRAWMYSKVLTKLNKKQQHDLWALMTAVS